MLPQIYALDGTSVLVNKAMLAEYYAIGPDVRVSLEEIAEQYGIKDFDVEAVYQDITVFPHSG